MKHYKSLKELDRDVQISKLKAKIKEEEIKLNFANIKEDLSPKSLSARLLFQVGKTVSIRKIIGLFRRRKRH